MFLSEGTLWRCLVRTSCWRYWATSTHAAWHSLSSSHVPGTRSPPPIVSGLPRSLAAPSCPSFFGFYFFLLAFLVILDSLWYFDYWVWILLCLVSFDFWWLFAQLVVLDTQLNFYYWVLFLFKLGTESLLILLYTLVLWLIINFARYWIMFECGFEVNLVNSYLGFTLLYNSLLCYKLGFLCEFNSWQKWGFHPFMILDYTLCIIQNHIWIFSTIFLIFIFEYFPPLPASFYL